MSTADSDRIAWEDAEGARVAAAELDADEYLQPVADIRSEWADAITEEFPGTTGLNKNQTEPNTHENIE
jgi:hypothetical protein